MSHRLLVASIALVGLAYFVYRRSRPVYHEIDEATAVFQSAKDKLQGAADKAGAQIADHLDQATAHQKAAGDLAQHKSRAQRIIEGIDRLLGIK